MVYDKERVLHAVLHLSWQVFWLYSYDKHENMNICHFLQILIVTYVEKIQFYFWICIYYIYWIIAC